MAAIADLGGGMTAVTRVEPKERHGRRETRQLWALTDPALNAHAGEAGVHATPWPHLAQVLRVRRQRVNGQTGDIQEEVSYAITSLGPEQADAARLLELRRGHWGIENKLHWVRDVTFGEDGCPIRSGAAPEAMAACRNLVIALVRRAGHANVAAAVRTFGSRPATAIALLASAGLEVMK
jgi:hypothetical protein